MQAATLIDVYRFAALPTRLHAWDPVFSKRRAASFFLLCRILAGGPIAVSGVVPLDAGDVGERSGQDGRLVGKLAYYIWHKGSEVSEL